MGKIKGGSMDIKAILIFLITLTVLTFIIVSILFGLNDMIKYPVVYWSYSENKCTFMVIEGENCDCSRLNEFKKYERVWVK